MDHELTELLDRLASLQASPSLHGRVTLHLTASPDVPARVVHLRANDEGWRVTPARDEVGDETGAEAVVDVGWQDLLSLFRGEDNVQDLLETRRARVTGHRKLALSACQALMEAMPDGSAGARLDDRMRPYPGVRVHQTFTIRPFDPGDPHTMPIVINAFNRVSCLRALVEALRVRGYDNLYVIDNASDYPPLLDYYRDARLSVFFLDKNVGCYSMWRTDIERQFLAGHYVYTDPDVVPVEDCPEDFMAHFLRVLHGRPTVGKVGFALKIDDLPAWLPYRDEIVSIERHFWANPLDANLYWAALDTCFALYGPGVRGGHWVPSIRTAGRYLARHVTWYLDPADLPDDEIHYRRTSYKSTHWTSRLAAYPFGAPLRTGA